MRASCIFISFNFFDYDLAKALFFVAFRTDMSIAIFPNLRQIHNSQNCVAMLATREQIKHLWALIFHKSNDFYLYHNRIIAQCFPLFYRSGKPLFDFTIFFPNQFNRKNIVRESLLIVIYFSG